MEIKDYTAGQPVPLAGVAVVLKNLPVVALFVVLTMVTKLLLSQVDRNDWITFVVLNAWDVLPWSILSVALFSTVLKNTTGFKALRAIIIFGVFWRDMVLVLIYSIVGGITWLIAVVIYAYLAGLIGVPGMLEDGFTSTSGLTVFEYAYSFLVYGFFGTWLAAVVVDGDRRFSAAFARGEQLFERSVVQMMIFLGPIVLLMAASYTFAGDYLFRGFGSIDWLFVSGSLGAVICEVFLTGIVVVILSRVYLEAGD